MQSNAGERSRLGCCSVRLSMNLGLGPPASRRPVAIEAKNLAAGTAALPGIARWFKGSMRELIRGILAPNTGGVGSH